MGIDGDWVPRQHLQVSLDQFMVHDLCSPLRLDRSFDLAISLEVGEHLPPACEETLVASLARIAPVVLFSAAVPQQGGNDHLNEQRPGYCPTFSRAWVRDDRFRQTADLDEAGH